ncbi:hypothetical protein PGT21_002530 [Puccinia graminis f. sp. tritici]|uniref:Uncharacterized protein n=1 Tax=Puccinia graminis f. sp. tritici TaxID=56615 RepID=A0A5B0ML01_PUCGR|nr:hypothetical protein PGT21_002530 [Puccinia graminis f. sp. tritici]
MTGLAYRPSSGVCTPPDDRSRPVIDGIQSHQVEYTSLHLMAGQTGHVLHPMTAHIQPLSGPYAQASTPPHPATDGPKTAITKGPSPAPSPLRSQGRAGSRLGARRRAFSAVSRRPNQAHTSERQRSTQLAHVSAPHTTLASFSMWACATAALQLTQFGC